MTYPKQLQKGRILIHQERPQDTTTKGGIILPGVVAERINPEWAGWQNTGVVKATGPNSEVPVGTRVRFHHNTVENGTKWADNHFVIEEKFVYYYEQDGVHAVGQHIITEPIIEAGENVEKGGILLTTKPSEQYRVAKVRSLPPVVPEDYWEVQNGDVVIWSMKKPIKIEVGDEMWNVLRWEHIIGLSEPISDEELAERKKNAKEIAQIVQNVVLEVAESTGVTQKYTGVQLGKSTKKRSQYFI